MVNAACFVAAAMAALVAGVFFAFSNFIMAGLVRTPPAEGSAAMRAINVTVVNPGFMGLLFGTAVLSVGLIVLSIGVLALPSAKVTLAAAIIYLNGCIGATLMFNVPLNNALLRAPPGTAEEATIWRRYLREWTRWNHVRTFASAVAAGLFGWAGVLQVMSG